MDNTEFPLPVFVFMPLGFHAVLLERVFLVAFAHCSCFVALLKSTLTTKPAREKCRFESHDEAMLWYVCMLCYRASLLDANRH